MKCRFIDTHNAVYPVGRICQVACSRQRIAHLLRQGRLRAVQRQRY